MTRTLPSVGELINLCWDFTKKNWKSTLKYTIPVAIFSLISNAFQSVLDEDVLSLLGESASELLLPLGAAAFGVLFIGGIATTLIVIALLQKVSNQILQTAKPLSTGTAMLRAVAQGILIFGINLLALIPIIASITGAIYLGKTYGFAAGALPAILFPVLLCALIWLNGSFSFAPFFLFDAQMNPWAALKASMEIIKGHWWAVIGRGFVLGLIVGAVQFGVMLAFLIPAGIAAFLIAMASDNLKEILIPGGILLGVLALIFVSIATTIFQLLFTLPGNVFLYKTLRKTT